MEDRSNPYYVTRVKWERSENPEFLLRATVDGQTWELRVNDFPEEPLYTLFIDNQEVTDLESWSTNWQSPQLHPIEGKEGIRAKITRFLSKLHSSLTTRK